MVWDPNVPATNAALLSAPIRANFQALNAIVAAGPAAGNPMTAPGDLIRGGASGVPTRLAIGTNGYVLTLVAGLPAWQAPAAPTYPLLAPDGTTAAPSYGFAGGGAGIGRNIFFGNELDLIAGGNVCAYFQPGLFALSGADLRFVPDNTNDLGTVGTARPRSIYVGTALIAPVVDFLAGAAPATPAAGHVLTYAKTDKRLYQKDDAGVETQYVIRGPGVTVTYSASMTLNAALGDTHSITATNATAFTINAPSNPTIGQLLTVRIRNTSGGALGVATWNAVFKLAAWTQPATATSRAITFLYDGTNWVETARTTVDVPN